MRTKVLITGVVIPSLAVLLSACGSSSGGGADTDSCPNWNLGDSMTYLRTKTVSSVPTVRETPGRCFLRCITALM